MTAGEPPFGADGRTDADTRAPADAESGGPGDDPSVGSRAVSPTQIGEFVRLNGCPRYHAYEFDADRKEQERNRKDWKEAFEPLSPLLAVEGETFERDCEDALAARARAVVDHEEIDDAAESRAALCEVVDRVRSRLPGDAPVVTTQTYLEGTIGAWAVAGNADFLLFWPTPRGFEVRVLDAKAAHEQKTYQQVQVATYALLLREVLAALDPSCEWAVTGGVLTREHTIEGARSEDLPAFDLGARETDVRRLLAAEGVFDRLREERREDEPGYQLGPKCHGCAYKEACYTDAIESQSTALLGLTRGEQSTLAAEGVRTIADLATLCHPPGDPRPYDYDRLEPAPERRGRYRTLVEEPGLGERLPRYVQRAQALLGRFEPEHLYARAEREAPWLLGAGDGTLPEDDPPYEADLPIERRSLVRVYCHVVHDHRRDRIAMASAYVTSSRHHDRGYEPLEVARLTETVADDPERSRRAEADLLESFVESVFDAVRTVARRTGFPERAPIHWYFYTDTEREALVEATKRHSHGRGVPALRDLLGLRGAIADDETTATGTRTETRNGAESRDGGAAPHETGSGGGIGSGVDQPMVSIVEREFESRKAPRTPNTGLIAAVEQLTPEEDAVEAGDWTYTADGEPVDLRAAFRYRLFDHRVPYRTIGARPGGGTENGRGTRTEEGDGTDGGIELLCDPEDADGYYPSRVRRGASIPLEYVWAATGRLTDDVVQEITSGDGHGPVEPFRWIDADARDRRIAREDLERLGRRLAACVAHVERGLRYRSTDVTGRKHPIDLGRLESFSLGETDVGRGATEFLDLEYGTQRRERLAHYGLPVAQRVRTGESVPVVVERTEVRDGTLYVEGRLPYDGLFDDGDRVARSCRVKGTEESAGGSWMVANELDRTGEPAGSTNPYAIERGVPVTIEHVDPGRREIAFTALDTYRRANRYQTWHRGWTTDPTAADDDDRTVAFEENSVFVLDPQTDDVNGQRAFDVLASCEDNALRELLDGLADGEIETPTTDAIDAGAVERFLEWSDRSAGLSPNPEQAAFVRETDARISLLQGPPGTGKTGGALAPAVLSRAFAFESAGKSLAGVVVGESHKAVDEVATDVADWYERYRDDPNAPGSIDDLRLVRLRDESPGDPSGSPIEYLEYHTDEERLEELAERLLAGQRGPQRTLGDPNAFGGGRDAERRGRGGTDGTGGDGHVMVFATPGRLYGLATAIGRVARDASAATLLEEGRSFFDLLAVDEASMMRLPSVLLCGAFVHEDAQVLVAGDHRQMPPVRTHEWDREDRRTIEEVAPYCSALDFLRLLRGDDVDGVETGELRVARDATIPVTRLEETYRCHEVVADFLKRHVYRHDDIAYRSSVDSCLGVDADRHADRSDGLHRVLGAEPLVLVLHDEAESQQSNPTEAALTAAVAAGLEEVGVVTPHNAQKGLLQSLLEDDIEVDTVERFQGGERDSIVVSATASDPDFLEAERDFILNPNRLTVAMSRMQRKLVVVASRSVFDVVPPDVEGYERARLWKGLYEDLRVLDRDPDWTGDAADFAGSSSPIDIVPDTGVEVYTFDGRPSGNGTNTERSDRDGTITR